MSALYVDVSDYDRLRRGGPLDWNALAMQVPGVMLARATYGDPEGWHKQTVYFQEHQAGAAAAGYRARGGYHNLIHSADDAGIARQVDWLRAELDTAGATFGMLDVERYEELGPLGLWPTYTDVVKFHARWAQVDRRPLCTYLAQWVWVALGKPDLTVLPGPLTNANYPPLHAGLPAPMYAEAGGDSGRGWLTYGGRPNTFWQYTSTSNLAAHGASNRTDVNAYRGTLEELIVLLGGGPAVGYPKRKIVTSSLLKGQVNGQLPMSILVTTPGQAGGVTVRLIEPAAWGWRALCWAAAKENHILKATSAADSYRTRAQQESTFLDRWTTVRIANRPTCTYQGKTWYLKQGKAIAAVPGTSNHGWAAAVDCGEERDFDAAAEPLDSPTLAWLLAHEQDFGWFHGVDSEPWHLEWYPGDVLPPAVAAYKAAHGGGTSPTPPTTVEDDDMRYVLVRFKDAPASHGGPEQVYLADGFRLQPKRKEDIASGKIANDGVYSAHVMGNLGSGGEVVVASWADRECFGELEPETNGGDGAGGGGGPVGPVMVQASGTLTLTPVE